MTSVAQFCTFPHGGAATAAIRHHQSLREANVDSQFYYHRNQQDTVLDESFVQLDFEPPKFGIFSGAVTRRLEKNRQRRVYDLFNRFLAVRPEGAETFSMAELPEPTRLDWKQIAADVVHLHWISYFADYPSFFSSIPRHVPIVWSLHDTNAFTGGCHYTSNCSQFKHGCGSCPQLVNRHRADVSRASFASKKKAFEGHQIHVVAPCDWMLSLARESSIWPRQTSFSKIEYGLDLVNDYPPVSSNQKQAARHQLGLSKDVPLVAFGAMDVANRRKGFQHLVPALHQLKQRSINFECLVFGDGKLESDLALPRLHEFGFVDTIEKKRQIYAAADLVVVPSIEDNQPQVGLEAMACGTPVVAFDATGMPEYVIDQQTGLLATAGDEQDLAAKIERLISDPAFCRSLGDAARLQVESRFERSTQREKWLQLYESSLHSQRKAA